MSDQLGSGNIIIRADVAAALKDLTEIDRILKQVEKTADNISAGPGLASFTSNLERQKTATLESLGTLRQLPPQISAVEKSVTASTNPIARFTGVLDKAEVSLRRVGLTSRDISVILGAGLAGGVAFAVRSFVDFIGSSVKLAAELEKIQNLTEGFFGEFANSTEEFAKQAVDALGLTRREALKFQNDFGRALLGVGVGQQDAQKLAETLTTLSVALARSTPGQTVESAHTALAAIFRNEFDALEKFTGGLKKSDIQAEAVRIGLADTTKAVTKQDEALAAINLTVGRSEVQLRELASSTGDLASESERFNAQLEEVQIALGTILLPTLVEFLENVNLLLTPITKLSEFVDFLGQKAEETGGKLDKFNAKLANTGRGLILGGLIGGIRALFEDANKAADAVGDIADEEDILRAALNATTGQIEVNTEKLEQLADARVRLNRAIEDSERRVDEAERRRARAEEDGNRRVFRALRDRRNAYRDQARAIEDANERIADAQLQAARDIRDAEEALSDARREDVKADIKETEDRKKALRDRANSILDATLAIESAQRAGNAEAENQARIDLTRARQNEDIKDREKELADADKDRALEISRLERDLAETRIDALDAVSDARRDHSRVVEDQADRIVEAEEKVTDAIRERDEANQDAARNFEEALRDQERAVGGALENFKKLSDEVGDLAEKTKVAADQMNRLKDILLNPAFTEGGLNPFGVNPRNPDPFGPGSDSFQPRPKPGDDDFIGPVPTRQVNQTVIINEAHDSEATYAAFSRRAAQDVNA